jgi:predicted TIM-barrel fold metal-dependent hydrolase
MKLAEVSAAMNCPPIWDPGAREYARQTALKYPDKFCTLDWVDLSDPDARAQIRSMRDKPGVVGTRFLTATLKKGPGATGIADLNWPPDDRFDWLWPELQQLGMPVSLYGPVMMPKVEEIAQRYPSLRMVIDHFAVAGSRSGPSDPLPMMDNLTALARLPNVAIKLTAAPSYATDEYPFISMHEPVKRLLDLFGPTRLFWGTDITRLRASWGESVRMFTEHMPWLSKDDLSLIMGKALCDWFDLKAPVKTESSTNNNLDDLA